MSSVRVAQAMTLCSCVCSALLVGLNVGELISGGVHVAGIGGTGTMELHRRVRRLCWWHRGPSPPRLRRVAEGPHPSP
jgi:hypothetical protein